jgi:hypothetical protein
MGSLRDESANNGAENDHISKDGEHLGFSTVSRRAGVPWNQFPMLLFESPKQAKTLNED